MILLSLAISPSRINLHQESGWGAAMAGAPTSMHVRIPIFLLTLTRPISCTLTSRTHHQFHAEPSSSAEHTVLPGSGYPYSRYFHNL